MSMAKALQQIIESMDEKEEPPRKFGGFKSIKVLRKKKRREEPDEDEKAEAEGEEATAAEE